MNNYLEKWFFIIENNSKQLSILPDDVKIRIYAILQLETYFIMAKKTAIYSVASTIKKLHIQSYLHFIYKQTFYDGKQDEINSLFDEYNVPLFNDLIILLVSKNGNKFLMLLLIKNI